MQRFFTVLEVEEFDDSFYIEVETGFIFDDDFIVIVKMDDAQNIVDLSATAWTDLHLQK